MDKEYYDKVATVMPMADVIDTLMADLRNAVDDAKNQAENGSATGMAVAVGRLSNTVDNLSNAWLTVKG